MTEENSTIHVTVNGGESRELQVSEEGFVLDGRKYRWDVSKLPDGSFHIILEGRNYLAELLQQDESDKKYQIKLNGNIYEVQLSDRYDQLLHRLGMDTNHATSEKSLKAPMPGMILKVMVSEGHEVEQGDPLIVLKAMKMENVIRAPGKAVIMKVPVREGQAVEKNEDLILF